MDYEAIADLFKIFADETRIKIMHFLEQGENSVSEIALALDMNQSAISHQLTSLRKSKLVKCKKSGRQSIYSLDCEHAKEIIKCGMEHLGEK